jgi:hypothetical protein
MSRVRPAPSAALFVGVILGCGVGACGLLVGVSDLPFLDAGAEGGASADAAPSDANDEAPVCVPPTVSGACAPFPQRGCEAGQDCEIVASGVAACAPAGSIPRWHNCVGDSDQCGAGHECIGGVCKPFCCSAADCEGGVVTCEQITSTGGPSGTPLVGLEVCSAGCDPSNPTAICGQGVTCSPFPWDGNGHDHGDCIGGVGTGMGPDACAVLTDCAPGFYCLPDDDCAAWCRMDAPVCSGALICTSFQTKVVIGGVEYGVCN